MDPEKPPVDLDWDWRDWVPAPQDTDSDSGWEPGFIPKEAKTFKCWVPNCNSEGFTNLSNLQRHTRLTHNIKEGPFYPSAKDPEPLSSSSLVQVKVEIDVSEDEVLGEGDHTPHKCEGGLLPGGEDLYGEDLRTPRSRKLVAYSPSPTSPGNSSSISPGTPTNQITPVLKRLVPYDSSDQSEGSSPSESTAATISPLFSGDSMDISPEVKSLMNSVCSDASPVLRHTLPVLTGDLSGEVSVREVDDFGVPLSVLNDDFENTPEKAAAEGASQGEGDHPPQNCAGGLLPCGEELPCEDPSTPRGLRLAAGNSSHPTPGSLPSVSPGPHNNPVALAIQVMNAIFKCPDEQQLIEMTQKAIVILSVQPGISPITGLPPPTVPATRFLPATVSPSSSPARPASPAASTPPPSPAAMEVDYDREIDKMFEYVEEEMVVVEEEEKVVVEETEVVVKDEDIKEEPVDEMQLVDPLHEKLVIGKGIPAEYQDRLVELFTGVSHINKKTCVEKSNVSEWFKVLWTQLVVELKRPCDAVKMVKNCVENKRKGKPARPPRVSEKLKVVIRDRLFGIDVDLESIQVMADTDEEFGEAWGAVKANNSTPEAALYSIKRMANSEVKKPKSRK